MKWSLTSKSRTPKLNPVETQPLSFWSKSLLPKVDHRGTQESVVLNIKILRLTRNPKGESVDPFRDRIQKLYVDGGVNTSLEIV